MTRDNVPPGTRVGGVLTAKFCTFLRLSLRGAKGVDSGARKYSQCLFGSWRRISVRVLIAATVDGPSLQCIARTLDIQSTCMPLPSWAYKSGVTSQGGYNRSRSRSGMPEDSHGASRNSDCSADAGATRRGACALPREYATAYATRAGARFSQTPLHAVRTICLWKIPCYIKFLVTSSSVTIFRKLAM